jgi:hypothetical protein
MVRAEGRTNMDRGIYESLTTEAMAHFGRMLTPHLPEIGLCLAVAVAGIAALATGYRMMRRQPRPEALS